MKQTRYGMIILATALLFCCLLPVSAVLLEVTCKGTVSTTDSAKKTITIKNPLQYGCEYPPTGPAVCTWKPMTEGTLTGTVPDAAVFSVFHGGENAVATSIGGAGGTWMTLAKIYGPKETEQLVTDIVGDPGTVPLPLIGNYVVETETVPDCAACTGTVCTAREAKVTVRSSGSTVAEKALAPGASFTYNGRNDGSSVMVTFVSGQAASQSCPGKAGMTGPQALSVFIVKVAPPVGYGQVDIRTATTTRPEEALPSLSATPTPSPAPTKSGLLFPLAAVAGLIVAVLIAGRK